MNELGTGDTIDDSALMPNMTRVNVCQNRDRQLNIASKKLEGGLHDIKHKFELDPEHVTKVTVAEGGPKAKKQRTEPEWFLDSETKQSKKLEMEEKTSEAINPSVSQTVSQLLMEEEKDTSSTFAVDTVPQDGDGEALDLFDVLVQGKVVSLEDIESDASIKERMSAAELEVYNEKIVKYREFLNDD